MGHLVRAVSVGQLVQAVNLGHLVRAVTLGHFSPGRQSGTSSPGGPASEMRKDSYLVVRVCEIKEIYSGKFSLGDVFTKDGYNVPISWPNQNEPS